MPYDGSHSIIFTTIDGSEERNTWDDWHLIPTSRPTTSTPGSQNKFVEIPGMDGSYDISDYLRSDIAYADRSGSFEFVVDNGHEDWLTIYRNLLTFLHGQRMRMILTDDPDWYYEGRFAIDEWKSEAVRSRVTISYRVGPFKYSTYGDFVENVIWDTFCFERDTDWSAFWHIELTSNKQPKTYNIDAYGVRVAVIVRLVSGDGGTASFGGVTRTLSTAGEEVTLGSGSRIGSDPLTIKGVGVFDVGWKKVSM